MTWTKTGDEFADECWTLSDAAYRLHHEGLTWSNRKGLDGKLDKDEMVRWAKRPGAAEELVAIGWWEDHGTHFQIIHHIGYQRTAAQIAHQSLVNKANRAKGVERPVRNKSSDKSSDERDWTGLDKKNRGTSLRNSEIGNGETDSVYAEDYRNWVAEDEPPKLDRRRILHRVTCEYVACGVEFDAKDPRTKFCSDAHKAAEYRRRARQRA